jgi:hypothetical protein
MERQDMKTNERKQIESLMGQLEELWAQFDELCASFSPDDWSRKHGPDWVFADVPYHMYFFDQEFIAGAIERGPSAEGGRNLQTFRDMNRWSKEWFDKRPADQTPQQSLAQYRASREAIRRAVAPLNDADLDRPLWFPIVSARGWRTVGFALWFCLIHTWNELEQLRLYAGRETPKTEPATTHIALEGLVRIQQIFLDRKKAKQTPFTMVWEITGPGGGAWTMRVADGAYSLTEGRSPEADLVMTQSVETFVRIFDDMLEQKAAIGNGEMQVSSLEAFATYQHLFPPPTPDGIVEPMAD